MKRAYSVLEIKGIDDGERVIEGIATTPETDRMTDIIEPKGALFTLPIPLLWQHNNQEPVGQVFEVRVKDDGIRIKARFAKVNEPASLKEDLDRAWAMVKAKLVRGLSIGFNPLEWSDIKGTYGVRFTKWEWLELSAVTIAANAEATITAIKSADFLARRTEVRKGLRLASRLSAGTPGSPAAVGHRNILLPE